MQTPGKIDGFKLEKHKELVFKLRNINEVKAWIKYEALSPEQKIVLTKKWDKYYQDCKNTPEAELHLETKNYLKSHNMDQVKYLGNQAKLMLINGFHEISKPSTYDPQLLKQTDPVWQYLRSKEVVDITVMNGMSDLF
jgi:hypothetical protein